jgi:CHAD domain-containing protein
MQIMPEDLKLFDEFAKLRALQCVARFKTRLFTEECKKEEFRKECRRLQFMIVDYQDKIMERDALQAYESVSHEIVPLTLLPSYHVTLNVIAVWH